MRSFKVAVVLVAVAIVTGPIVAQACTVSGKFVCQRDPSIVVGLQDIVFTETSPVSGYSFTATTDETGALVAHVDWESWWTVSYYGTMYCGDTAVPPGPSWSMGLVLVPDSNPKCTPSSCPVSLPEVNPWCPSRPLGKPNAECELFGLTVIDKSDGTNGLTWVATTDARVALVKAGGCYQYFVDVTAGQLLTSPNAQGISHVTYCGCPLP